MLKIGLQLFSVRDACEKDFVGTIQKVAAMGYQGLEFAGYYGMEAKELRKLIDDLGVKAVNSHVSLINLVNHFDQALEYANILGMKTLTVPFLAEEYHRDKEAVDRTSETMTSIAEQCAKNGLQLCYHNHDFEFASYDNGYILDAFMRKIPSLKLELDTFWAFFAGVNVKEYLKQNQTKLQYIHLKDLVHNYQEIVAAKKPDERVYGLPLFSEVGEGCLDIEAFVKIALEAEIEWAFVEQDICQRPSLDSVSLSLENLRKKGLVQ